MDMQKETEKEMEANSVTELQEIINDVSEGVMVCVTLEVQDEK